MAKKQIVRAFQFRSKSSPGVVYSTLVFSDGTASCNCKGWCRRAEADGSRTCCHVTSPEVLSVLRLSPPVGAVASTGRVIVTKRAVPASTAHGQPGAVSSRPVRRFQFEDEL